MRSTGARAAGDLRQRVEDARVDLLVALAANRIDLGEPARVIPLLEPALECQLESEDLARALRAAFLETGHTGRAAEIQRTHRLDG